MLILLLVFVLPIAFNCEHIVFERHLDIILVQPGQFGVNGKFMIRFHYIHAGIPARAVRGIQVAPELAHQIVDFAIQRERLTGLPTNKCHHNTSCYLVVGCLFVSPYF